MVKAPPMKDKPMVEALYEWAWETAVPGETSSETMKRAIAKALQHKEEAE